MEVPTLTLDREEALRMWRKYQSHKHHQTPLDGDIEKIYGAIAKGKIVVNALSAIVKAGVDKDHLPKLAIARADEKEVWLLTRHNGSAQMSGVRYPMSTTSKTRLFEFGEGSFPTLSLKDRKALVPHIPPDIRPKRGLQNYHILWEADWYYEPPVDPMLLRRIGKAGDMWLVVAAWDLTEVERAVMDMHKPVRR